MKKYTVELRCHKEVEVEAEHLKEAIKIAKEQNPGFIPEGASSENSPNYELIEQCNGCGMDMIEEDRGGIDQDGNSYCKECHGAATEDYLQWLGKVVDIAKAKGLALKEQDDDLIDELNDLYGEYIDEPAQALEQLILKDLVITKP